MREGESQSSGGKWEASAEDQDHLDFQWERERIDKTDRHGLRFSYRDGTTITTENNNNAFPSCYQRIFLHLHFLQVKFERESNNKTNLRYNFSIASFERKGVSVYVQNSAQSYNFLSIEGHHCRGLIFFFVVVFSFSRGEKMSQVF